MEIVDLIAEDHKVIGHFRCSGTHRATGWACRAPAAGLKASTRCTSSRSQAAGWSRRSGWRTTCRGLRQLRIYPQT
jgi:hypothetical protein